MPKQVNALMLSSDMGLWKRYCKMLKQKNFLLLLLPIKELGRCRQAISEQELVILDIIDDNEEWIKIIKTIREILGEKKQLLVVSNLEGKRIAEVINAGADDYLRRLENEELFVACVTSLMKRYQLS